jgi:hypothetical protein
MLRMQSRKKGLCMDGADLADDGAGMNLWKHPVIDCHSTLDS